MLDPGAMVEVLLVEDDPSDAMLTLRSLRKAGFGNNILHVTDGAQALRFLFGTDEYAHSDVIKPPRLVLLDLKLPKVEGMDVLRAIRADSRIATLPVVLLTSSRQERDVLEGYELHANAYVVKPVDFHQFADAVRTLGMFWLLFNTPPLRPDAGQAGEGVATAGDDGHEHLSGTVASG